MLKLKPILLLVMVALLGLALTGCSEDDPATPETASIPSEIAEEWSTTALEMINEMANQVPAIAGEDYSGSVGSGILSNNHGVGLRDFSKSEYEPQWNADESAYVLELVEDITEEDFPGGQGEMRLYTWIQFRDAAGAPIPTSLGAQTLIYRSASGMTLRMDNEGTVTEMEYDLETDMVITYNQDETYTAVGSGEAVMDIAQVSDNGTQAIRFDMSWGLDLDVMPYGCSEGTAFVQANNYRLDAVYDGAGLVSWELEGPGYSSSGYDSVDCQMPVK